MVLQSTHLIQMKYEQNKEEKGKTKTSFFSQEIKKRCNHCLLCFTQAQMSYLINFKHHFPFILHSLPKLSTGWQYRALFQPLVWFHFNTTFCLLLSLLPGKRAWFVLLEARPLDQPVTPSSLCCIGHSSLRKLLHLCERQIGVKAELRSCWLQDFITYIFV